MLTNLAVAAAYLTILPTGGHKQHLVQCKYCVKAPFSKHTSRQRQHLQVCHGYLQHQKDIQEENAITKQTQKEKIQQPLFGVVSPLKRKQLDKLAALATFCGGRPLSMWEDTWMQEFFTQGIGYQPPCRDCLAIMLLDMIYLETKQEVDRLLEANNMINLVFDESNNQAGDRILNITVFTKDHESFNAFSESAGAMKLDAQATAAWMLEKIDQLTRSDFKKVNSVATDTCSLERAVWNILSLDPRLQHAFFILCDFHRLQLLIKDLLGLESLSAIFLQALKIVNSLRKDKHHLGILRKHQQAIYCEKRALIASTILRWGTQVDLLESVSRNKQALQRLH